MHIDNEEELKKQFAKGLVDEELTPFKLAHGLSGSTNIAAFMMCHWYGTPEIADLMSAYRITRDKMQDLPDKAALASLIWRKLDSKHIDDKDFTPMAKLYAEVIKAIGPTNNSITVNDNSTTNVQNNYKGVDFSSDDPIEVAKQYAQLMSK